MLLSGGRGWYSNYHTGKFKYLKIYLLIKSQAWPSLIKASPGQGKRIFVQHIFHYLCMDLVQNTFCKRENRVKQLREVNIWPCLSCNFSSFLQSLFHLPQIMHHHPLETRTKIVPKFKPKPIIGKCFWRNTLTTSSDGHLCFSLSPLAFSITSAADPLLEFELFYLFSS